MSLMVSFVLSLFPRDVLDEVWVLAESVSEVFPTYFYAILSKLVTHLFHDDESIIIDQISRDLKIMT